MGEYIDRLTAAQLLELSALERVKSYTRKVHGKPVQVSAHTRHGDGSGKATAGRYVDNGKQFQKGKEVFTNSHGVDIASLASGDEVTLDPKAVVWKVGPGMPQHTVDRWNKAKTWMLAEPPGEWGARMEMQLQVDEGLAPYQLVDPAMITKVTKPAKIQGREEIAQKRRLKWNAKAIAVLENSLYTAGTNKEPEQLRIERLDKAARAELRQLYEKSSNDPEAYFELPRVKQLSASLRQLERDAESLKKVKKSLGI